jgi:hypothetical protein
MENFSKSDEGNSILLRYYFFEFRMILKGLIKNHFGASTEMDFFLMITEGKIFFTFLFCFFKTMTSSSIDLSNFFKLGFFLFNFSLDFDFCFVGFDVESFCAFSECNSRFGFGIVWIFMNCQFV